MTESQVKIQVYDLKINKHACSGCNVCVVSCPINFSQLRTKGYLTKENAVILVKNGLATYIYDENRDINCDGCGICIKSCPQCCIQLEIINEV